jgi:hypothetical protein
MTGRGGFGEGGEVGGSTPPFDVRCGQPRPHLRWADNHPIGPVEGRTIREDRDTLETVVADLSEARAMLYAARHALERLRDASEGQHAPLRQAESQVEQMDDEVARIERVIEGQAVGAR